MNLDLSGKPKSDNRMLAIGLAVLAAGLALHAVTRRAPSLTR